MSNFETNRFMTYAKWDLTINKSFYLNCAIVTAIVVVILTLSSATQYFNFYETGAPEAYTIIYGLSISCIEWSVLIFFGFFLHNMLTRKSRTYELSIPASNLEKFTWHIIFCVVGGALFSFIGIIIFDIIQTIWIGSSIGFDQVHHIVKGIFSYDTVEMFKSQSTHSDITTQFAYIQSDNDNIKNELTNVFQDISEIGGLCGFSSLFFQISIMVLVNSFKYKNNIPWTLLIVFCISITAVIVIAALATIYGPSMFNNEYTYGSIQKLFNTLHVKTALEICTAIQFILGTAFWAWTYRNYTHSQIISKRNQ